MNVDSQKLHHIEFTKFNNLHHQEAASNDNVNLDCLNCLNYLRTKKVIFMKTPVKIINIGKL